MRNEKTGFARWSPSTQQFLDTCPAVTGWTPTDDGEFVEFTYDEAADVPAAPPGVYFDPDRADADERAALAESLLHHEIDRLTKSDLQASGDETMALHKILAIEGFGGREDAVTTFDDAREVALERLTWFRMTRGEEEEERQ
jgi:hypothetical protein